MSKVRVSGRVFKGGGRGKGRGGFQPLKKKNASLISSFGNKMLFDANTEVRKICLACLFKMRDQRQEVI